MKFLHVLLWILHCSVCVIFAQDYPMVETALGKVKGSFMKSAKGRKFSAFRGIRYAQAPVNANRFRPPIAVTSWGDDVLDATTDGYICPQTLFPEYLMSEDCLFLNVFTEDLKGSASVLVFIHGGGNILGSSHSNFQVGPQFLMDHNIVLVAMNYRLGALGFLTTETEDAPGNYGYLDQLMVLQWVHDHISRFGGNPNSVTIFGMGSGAMAVTLHMASPLSTGLFHRAIAMSGSTTHHFQIDNVALTRQLARHLSCPMYNPADILVCLRATSWQNITSVLNSWEPYGVPKPLWFYQIDDYFLLDTPTNIFAAGAFNKVPILTGVTRDEFAYLAYELNKKLLNDINENFDKYAPEFFTFELDCEESAKGKSRQIHAFYLNHLRVDQQLAKFGHIFADAIIGHGVYRLMELSRKHVDVYYYRNDYEGLYSLNPFSRDIPRVITHGDDMQYIFNSSFFSSRINVGDPDWFMVERMTEWWTSFAQNGVPSEIEGVKWLPSNSSSVFTMHNAKDLTFERRPFYFERYSQWDNMFPLRSSADQVRIAWMMTAGAVTLHVCAKNVL